MARGRDQGDDRDERETQSPGHIDDRVFVIDQRSGESDREQHDDGQRGQRQGVQE